MLIDSLLFPIVFLIGAALLATVSRSIRTLGKIELKKELTKNRKRYFFHFFTKKIFPKDGWTTINLIISATKQLSSLLYATTLMIYLISHPFFKALFIPKEDQFFLTPSLLATLLSIIVLTSLIIDFFAKMLGEFYPKTAFSSLYPAASLYLFLFAPITLLLLLLQRLFTGGDQSQNPEAPYKIKDKILELVLESELHHQLTTQDKKLMLSVASFRDRIAREIMVPRIDIFMLSSKSTIDDAAKAFISEGYSRIPVYKNTLDNIHGVLLYKDLLSVYTQNHQDPILKQTAIESLVKSVVYTPETKKISALLQEMKSKQIHMAIVVDEYGGTEGIVTIEDILEELVGEIADEYDNLQEEVHFKAHPQGGYIVDGKMNIIDIEKELGVLIPQSPEYDTLGGYIFHRAGTIPTKGWKIHHENFDLEILKSSDRSVEKVRIVSLQSDQI